MKDTVQVSRFELVLLQGLAALALCTIVEPLFTRRSSTVVVAPTVVIEGKPAEELN